MEPKTYLQYRQVNGRSSERAQLEAALGLLDRCAMLRLLSGISLSLNLLMENSSEAAQRAAIESFFPKSQATKILENGDVVFHRHQLLFLMQEVVKHCPNITPVEFDASRMEQLGQIFLMANDQLFDPMQPSGSPQDELLRLILEFLPISEANLLTSALLKMGRSHLMVTKFAEARRGQPGSSTFLFNFMRLLEFGSKRLKR